MRIVTAKLAFLLIGGFVLAVTGSAGAFPQSPAFDRITGGGWFIQQAGSSQENARSNFGWHGGVLKNAFWGEGNYIDHGPSTRLHVHSTGAPTGYLRIGADGTDSKGRPTGTRDICGMANVTADAGPFPPLRYRVRMKDAGEPGRLDMFGIVLYDPVMGLPMYRAWGQLNGGGNIQLHMQPPSSSAPTSDCPGNPTDIPFV